jgi:hypothetical protein
MRETGSFAKPGNGKLRSAVVDTEIDVVSM